MKGSLSPPTAGPTSPPWHLLPTPEALQRLGSTSQGLTQAEADRRLAVHGRNEFRAGKSTSAWAVLLGQLRSVIVLLLVAAAVVALLSGDPLDAGAIGAVLVLNVAIGFFTELRAHRAMEALLALEVPRARVLRDGQARELDARDLVPGDVIEVEAGGTVPADARLLEGAELRTVEAALTGESAPVDKSAGATLPEDATLPDRTTMIYKATAVVAGRGRGVVVATGMATEVGRIGALAAGVSRRVTPLERRLDVLGRRLAGAAILVAVVVVGIGIAQGLPLGTLLQSAIALAVAAVPEGLPVVGTIAMAVGVHRMARHRALVRHLPVVETLGSATVICTDKTGTLTAGAMTATVVRLSEAEVAIPDAPFTAGRELALALRIGALANRAQLVPVGPHWQGQGDPTEIALLAAARKAGLDQALLREEWPEVAEVPFSSERMLMATFHRTPEGLLACVKGAPRRIVALSTHWLGPDGVRELGEAGRERLLRLNRDLAARGLRVLALAMKEVGGTAEPDLEGLTWVGFVGMIDPPAPGVLETIRSFREAGIRTVMLTGDQQLTAETVARELGLLRPGESALDGKELDRLSDEQLHQAVGRTTTFSRVSPEAKLRIVTAYQARGEIVAMLGDGVNDAAALRKADIGVTLGGRGTDLAKEAADLILEDDRFPTIATAIEHGRVIFDNIRKFVFYLFSCNLAEILLLFGAALAGLPAPLNPLQILWLNLLTDTFPALALAVEPGEPAVMRQPPRDPQAALLSRSMVRATAGYAALIAAASLAAFLLSGSTAAFMTLALAQIFHLGNARSAGPVLAPERALANRLAVGAVLLALALQLSTVVIQPLARLLRVEPLAGVDWALIALFGLTPGVVGQGIKWAVARRPVVRA